MAMPQIALAPAVLFVVAAASLLGSPGPGIAALVALGRRRGWRGSLRFYLGLQLGLALALGLCAAGLLGLLRALPGAHLLLTVAGVGYLLWLAWRIAAAPVGQAGAQDAGAASSARAGFALGVANPKAWLAFAALLALPALSAPAAADLAVKCALCMGVIVIVDALWLGLGAAIGGVRMSARGERLFNLAMGSAVAASAAMIVL